MPASVDRVESVETLILGAGLAGLSAAFHLGERCRVAEATASAGGTASTLHHGQFQLDRGVHILYFRDPWTRNFIERDLGVQLIKQHRRSTVWIDNRLVPFPLQFNLSDTSPKTRIALGASFAKSVFENSLRRFAPSDNFEEWAQANFGVGMTRRFFQPYNQKLWGCDIKQLTTDWMDGYVPRPSTTAVIKGMFRRQPESVGANAEFWYPASGSIGSVASAIAKRVANVEYAMKLVRIDARAQRAEFSNGRVIHYDKLVSTIPLSALTACVQGDEFGGSQIKLESNPLSIVHILAQRIIDCGGCHWIYVPDLDTPFYRITLPRNISESTCPAGWSALTLEIGGKVADKAEMTMRCKQSLIEMGLLRPEEADSEVVWDELEHGYVKYDGERSRASATIRDRLRKLNITCIGRYGRWEYSNMESALIQGREIAKRLSGGRTQSVATRSLSNTGNASGAQKYFAARYPDRGGLMRRHLLRRGEPKRLAVLQRWIPQVEGQSILDAGCGDGQFLARLLHGRPTTIRLEDFVRHNVDAAYQRLQYKADLVEREAVSIADSHDRGKYDVVLALGIFDYEQEWNALLARLIQRCGGTLIVDFPKSYTVHNRLRKAWLGAHSVKLASCTRPELLQLLRRHDLKGEIVETDIQWIVKVDMSCNVATEGLVA